MQCPKCGAEAREGVKFCPQCGAQLAEGVAVTRPRPSAIAILSLTLGILALLPFIGIFLGIAAIALGIVALRKIALYPERLTGQGLAIAGIVVASVLMLCNLLLVFYTARISVPAFMDAKFRSQVARARADMRSIATGLEAYFIDNKCYPAWGVGEEGANSFGGPGTGVYDIPTFRIWKNANEWGTFSILTTPISYLVSYYRDPFADTEGATFGYYSDWEGWIMWSWGSDRDEFEREQWDLAPDVKKVYASEDAQPTLTLLTGTSSAPAHEAYTYDPTNGTVSPGDVWRVKQ